MCGVFFLGIRGWGCVDVGEGSHSLSLSLGGERSFFTVVNSHSYGLIDLLIKEKERAKRNGRNKNKQTKQNEGKKHLPFRKQTNNKQQTNRKTNKTNRKQKTTTKSQNN